MITDFYNVTTPAAEEPLSLATAKEWLRIRTSADDALITALIPAAVKAGEDFTNRVFVARTIEGYFSGLEVSQFENYPFVTLRRAPLSSIISVEVSVDGSFTAFTDYVLKETNGFSRVLFENGIFDASPDTDVPYPLKITFVSGYGEASDVPAGIITALEAHIAFLYENRGDVIADGKIGMPLETKAIYTGKFQIMNTFG